MLAPDLRERGHRGGGVVGARGDHGHHHGVDLVGGEYGGGDRRDLGGSCSGAGVDRVGRAGRLVHQPGELATQARRELDDPELLVRGEISGEHPQATGVADDGNPRPCRERLAGQQERGLGELLGVMALDDARLGEQGPHAGRGRRGCCGVRRSGALAGRRPAADDCQQGLALTEGAGEPRELPRIAERLEVQRGTRDVLVVVPGAEQVVARDVCLVAERDERADADARSGHQIHEGDADAAGLTGDGKPADRRESAGEGRVQPQVRVVADQAETVRADHPDAVPPGAEHQLLLQLRTTLAHLTKTGGDHDGTADARARSIFQRGDDTLGRDRDHSQVDRLRRSRAVEYAETPSTSGALGWTTVNPPAYPPSLIAVTTAPPMPEPSRRTP